MPVLACNPALQRRLPNSSSEGSLVPMIERRQLGTLSLLAAGSAAFGAEARPRRQEPTERLTVETAQGKLSGLRSADTISFKGVRYGESAAASRFRPPIAVQPWSGVKLATRLGNQCPQVNPDSMAWLDPSPQSEDCLYLNLWARPDAKKRPVMVWIHGGGYWWGSAGAPIYDGTRLAEKEDIVFVSVNHRLNAFGFLYLAGLGTEFGHTANIGLLDLVEALRWIQQNIAAFGGDPENITLFGESGGAMKISALMAMPSAKGLFAKAIMQSGATMGFLTPDKATETTRQLLRELGLTPGDASKLEHLPPTDLATAAARIVDSAGLWDISELPLGPVIDRATIPYQADEAAALALAADVPAIIGTNTDETSWLLALDGTVATPADDRELIRLIQAAYPEQSDTDLQRRIAHRRSLQSSVSRQQLLVQVTTDLWMGDMALQKAEIRASAGSASTFLYVFDWKDPVFGGRWAPHAGEVPFVLDALDQPHVMSDNEDLSVARAQIDPTGTRFELRDAMMRAWTNFARCGLPLAPHLPAWPAFRPEKPNAMAFGASPTARITGLPSLRAN